MNDTEEAPKKMGRPSELGPNLVTTNWQTTSANMAKAKALADLRERATGKKVSVAKLLRELIDEEYERQLVRE